MFDRRWPRLAGVPSFSDVWTTEQEQRTRTGQATYWASARAVQSKKIHGVKKAAGVAPRSLIRSYVRSLDADNATDERRQRINLIEVVIPSDVTIVVVQIIS